MELFILSLLGPLTLVADVAPQNQLTGAILTVVLVPCLFAYAIRQNFLCFWVTMVSIFVWLFVGMIGVGINC
ncbi:hypothetical protein CA54_00040 [Symmachiella macrocystis]|uniref:Uncharacterized protein n=1 Tax=Symmachiella macrocystis TaxID=2527985 RepID=A0A5C6BI34_9PLAN|nr:hypothetical protein CA54_00040 [Symmachiella macrocystis]